jgi:hypothetical protein
MPNFFCEKCDNYFTNAWAKESTPCTKCQATLVPTTRSRPIKIGPINKLPDDLLATLHLLLDEQSLGRAARVSKRWNAVAKYALDRYVPPMIGYGSTGEVSLKNAILGHLKNAKRLELAVDQFPCSLKYGSVLAYIFDNNIQVDLALGTPDINTIKTLQNFSSKQYKLKNTVTVVDKSYQLASHKMHNKIWVIDRKGVIVGSPNISFAGLEGGNLESCIHIHSPRLGYLFARYLTLLKQKVANKLLLKSVTEELDKYNSAHHKIRVALAPIVNISDFVVKELGGATKIIIRQFLISRRERYADTGTDIVEVLCGMAEKGVKIEIFIDEEAFWGMNFVQDAMRPLIEAGVRVYTQKPVLVINADEKIQHDKLILAELHDGVCRTLIGSAGFTVDVIANRNAENMISTDVQSVYNALLNHHNLTLDENVATTSLLRFKD